MCEAFGGPLSDLVGANDKQYDCLRDQQWRPNRPAAKRDTSREPIKPGDGPPQEALMDMSQRKHTQRKVVSPINISVLDKARWGGTCYGWAGRQPPFMGLMFRDLEAGKKIFSEWHNRWGRENAEDALRVTIVTGSGHPDRRDPALLPESVHRLRPNCGIAIS